MAQEGILKVVLGGAKGPGDTDFLKDVGLYVTFDYLNQKQTSHRVASGRGSDPRWNEIYVFNWIGPVTKLEVKIFGGAAGADDNFIGEAKVPLDALLANGCIPAAAYEVLKDGEHRGEIELGLTFIPGGRSSQSVQEALPLPPIQFWTFAYVTSMSWSSFNMCKAFMVVGDIPLRGLFFLAFVFMGFLVFLAML